MIVIIGCGASATFISLLFMYNCIYYQYNIPYFRDPEQIKDLIKSSSNYDLIKRHVLLAQADAYIYNYNYEPNTDNINDYKKYLSGYIEAIHVYNKRVK